MGEVYPFKMKLLSLDYISYTGDQDVIDTNRQRRASVLVRDTIFLRLIDPRLRVGFNSL